MPLSNTIANVYRAVLTLSAIGPHFFFLPAARPQCHLPCQRGLCHQPAWTPECQERQQEALNQGHSSVGTKTAPSPDAWTEQAQCLNTLNVTPVPKSLQKEQEEEKHTICCAGQIDEKGLYMFKDEDFYPHPDNVKAQGPVSIDFVPRVQTAT